LEEKRAKADMISSTIELMVKKEDFSKLEDVCTLTSKSTNGFHMRLRDSLKSVPLDVIENLDPEVKTKLQFNFKTIKNNEDLRGQKEISEESIKNYEDFTTKLAEENLEEVSNILLKVRIYISDLIHILRWIKF
jgi:short-subunit dehydrogenase involved in D-alanine esterification of teichoic acids